MRHCVDDGLPLDRMAGGEGATLFYLLRSIALLSILRRPVAAFTFSRCPLLTRRATHVLATAMSQKRTATETSPSLKDSIDKKSILYQWACHDDASFHDFSPEEATEIRASLLDWYRANRRKLPWRGDAPPYDGSTAGVNSNSKAKKQKDDKKQPSIRNFFASTKQPDSAGTTSQKPASDETGSEASGEALPVTAYGVWVSEIMLQQTRVEAVIPFYLKCTILD